MSQAQPLKLIFTDQSKVSTSAGAENSVIQILGSLYDSLETTYGTFSTRLCAEAEISRIFTITSPPQAVQSLQTPGGQVHGAVQSAQAVLHPLRLLLPVQLPPRPRRDHPHRHQG